MRAIYLDGHATTPVDPRVFEAMRPYFLEAYGNPSSQSHRFGWEAEAAVERARQQVADLIGAIPSEIIFTSGATESNNLALKGLFESLPDKRAHLVTVATEHRSVLDTCRALERNGARLTILPVPRDGRLDPEQIRAALQPDTALISVMSANNEVGVRQPIAEIGRIACQHGIRFHCDAVQSVGQLSMNVQREGIDLLSLSAHKIYGPKGVGALYIRKRDRPVNLIAQMDGGGQERGLRAGTLNVPGIVGLGEASRIAREAMSVESPRVAALRNRLRDRLRSGLDGVHINGAEVDRLPNNLSVSFEGVDGEALLMSLDDIAVSRGSACSSARKEISHVLLAMGIDDALAQATLRFGLGRFTTESDVDHAAEKIHQSVRHLRTLSEF